MRCSMIIDCENEVSDHTPSVARVSWKAERDVLTKLPESCAGDNVSELRFQDIFSGSLGALKRSSTAKFNPSH